METIFRHTDDTAPPESRHTYFLGLSDDGVNEDTGIPFEAIGPMTEEQARILNILRSQNHEFLADCFLRMIPEATTWADMNGDEEALASYTWETIPPYEEDQVG